MKCLFTLFILTLLPFKKEGRLILAADLTTQQMTNGSGSKYKNIDNNSSLAKGSLYQGTLNGNIKIWLYLHEQGSPCGGDATVINAMYKYDNQDKWILLSVATDKQKKNYCMVEDNFTGTLFIEKEGKFFKGYWISPDTEKKFKAELEKVSLEGLTFEELDEILFDDLIYNKNDC